jgi:hypothetical protein
LPALEHDIYSEVGVEEGGIKIKKKINFFHENGNFFRAKKIIFIPNHHFWMSEGSQTRYKKIFALAVDKNVKFESFSCDGSHCLEYNRKCVLGCLSPDLHASFCLLEQW